MKSSSFKFRLLGFIINIIALMMIINLYSIYITGVIENQYKTMINNMFDINKIAKDINLATFYFDNYISTKTHSNLDYYNKYLFDAQDRAKEMEKFMDNESMIYLKDIENTINSFSESANTTYNKFLLSGKYDEFYPYFLETKKISSYVTDYTQLLNNSYLNYNNKLYQKIKGNTKCSKYILIGLQCYITFFCLVFTFLFSKEITIPLNALVDASKKVSKGDFNIKSLKKSDINEINILYEGFNVMVRDIKEFIEKMREKADIEKSLQNEKMKNLIFENKLKEAQFKTLQSQINPHFLFNTLNTISQTAIIEEAYETERLLGSVSDLLRYSLSMIDRKSNIKNEIEIIKQYIYIQETRFKDRVKFNLNIDESCLDLGIPPMTLQPLIENAFIHGIEPKEEGGSISINVFKKCSSCIVEIEDDGKGMSKDRINEIMSKNGNYKGHTTGIGVKNVKERLNIFYNFKNIFKIESSENKGTKITLGIPLC